MDKCDSYLIKESLIKPFLPSLREERIDRREIRSTKQSADFNAGDCFVGFFSLRSKNPPRNDILEPTGIQNPHLTNLPQIQ